MENYHPEQAYQPQVNFVKEGTKIGIINGGIALILMYGSYFAGLETFVSVQLISLFTPYMIIILIVYGLHLRKRNGGFLFFKQGLQFAFMSYVMASLLIALGTYILFNLIDKDLTQKSFELGIEKTRKIMESVGAKPEDIDKQLEEFRSMPQKTGMGNIILGLGTDLIWHFVKSLLITLVIRKERPAF